MTENRQQGNLDSRLRTVWRRGQNRHVTSGMLAFFRWGVLRLEIEIAQENRVFTNPTDLPFCISQVTTCAWCSFAVFLAASSSLESAIRTNF